MNTKHPVKQVLGALLLLVGGWFSLSIVLRVIFGHFRDIWQAVLFVIFAALSAYLIYSGLRLINPQRFKPSRFGWGKIIFGSLMIFPQIASHFDKVPEGPLPLAQPSSPTEAISMKVTSVVIALIGVHLIVRGIRAGFSRRESQGDIQPPQSPA